MGWPAFSRRREVRSSDLDENAQAEDGILNFVSALPKTGTGRKQILELAFGEPSQDQGAAAERDQGRGL